MNTKNNKRRRASVERIEKAFVELLQTRELNEITVTDICKMTQLNRSTFYSNFVDIYDLADKIREELESEVSELFAYERAYNYNSNNYLKLLNHIKDNQIFYKTYFKLGYDSEHRTYVYDVNLARSYFDEKHIKYHIEFFKSGFNAVVKMWLKGGCEESPKEIAEIIHSEYQGR